VQRVWDFVVDGGCALRVGWRAWRAGVQGVLLTDPRRFEAVTAGPAPVPACAAAGPGRACSPARDLVTVTV
jgi:hypothetical protein